MKVIISVLVTGLLLGLGSQGNAQEVFGFKVTPDVIYGEGKIKQDGKISKPFYHERLTLQLQHPKTP